MAQYFISQGNKINVVESTDRFDKLPIGNYIVCANDNGFYLEKTKDFTLPKNLIHRSQWPYRWIKMWNEGIEKNLGILLTGEKGSGKTILAQLFCIESKMPVLFVNSSFNDRQSEFIDFLSQKVFYNCIVFIDEFEKIFEGNNNQLLSLLDGIFQTRLIFLLTSNSSNINYFMLNRLGRIRYLINFDQLDLGIVRELGEKLLIDKNQVEQLVNFFCNDYLRTFDTVINLIKEMNVFNLDSYKAAFGLNLYINDELYYLTIEILDGIYEKTILKLDKMYNQKIINIFEEVYDLAFNNSNLKQKRISRELIDNLLSFYECDGTININDHIVKEDKPNNILFNAIVKYDKLSNKELENNNVSADIIQKLPSSLSIKLSGISNKNEIAKINPWLS